MIAKVSYKIIIVLCCDLAAVSKVYTDFFNFFFSKWVHLASCALNWDRFLRLVQFVNRNKKNTYSSNKILKNNLPKFFFITMRVLKLAKFLDFAATLATPRGCKAPALIDALTNWRFVVVCPPTGNDEVRATTGGRDFRHASMAERGRMRWLFFII